MNTRGRLDTNHVCNTYLIGGKNVESAKNYLGI